MNKPIAAQNLLIFTILLMIMLLHPKSTDCLWMPRHPQIPSVYPPNPLQDPSTPLCNNQFTLANRACALVPYRSVGPPSPPVHHHHTAHRRHKRHDNGMVTPVEEECCRWLKEVDNVCACNVLTHLPIFLSKLTHNYTIVVNYECEVTFECGSRSA
ncbi:Tetratricopeptide repeat (TPR)-like superfamily protein [Striga hermonthica]|uniref:Tetratricopeptide repeat (TPR)-like superfamily protein n=1 Tax=Striga hermonthica TaxID=68872 RepID=A0A9N7R670_STRHE|nr:Tetratricopeptide repeat (TPR)-like superfamily protein [Striga hermonthica]